jgi:hypothetical protein
VSAAGTLDPERHDDMCPCDSCWIAPAADIALATGDIHCIRGFALVPDLRMAEAEANGFDLLQTAILQRSDGRSVSVYRDPDNKIAAAVSER